MKKIVSLLTAFVLCVLTTLLLFGFLNSHRNINSAEFGGWIDQAKFASYQMLTGNMGEDTLLVFGSSEFKHGRKTPYHPVNMFKGQKVQLMLVGKEYYQSLNHAITLGAMAPEMKNKKAAIILSPQWFTQKGVDDQAFTERFSENNYIGMLNNPSVSEEDKEYIQKRCKTLLGGKNLTLDAPGNGFISDAIEGIYRRYVQERSISSVFFKAMLKEKINHKNSMEAPAGEIDWEAYYTQAEEDARKETEGNPINVPNSFYKKNIVPKQKELKTCKEEVSFEDSPEYDDLRCFLDICKSNNIEILLINTPINGKWYDYAGCDQEKRKVYYDKIREIAEEYQVELKDLTNNEYTDGYFMDTVHFGWKGWVDVDEAIYRFQTGS